MIEFIIKIIQGNLINLDQILMNKNLGIIKPTSIKWINQQIKTLLI